MAATPPPGGLHEFLAAHGARVAGAVADALRGHPAQQAIGRAAEPLAGPPEGAARRLLGLALSGAPLPDGDLSRCRDLGVLAARRGVPLPVLAEAWDVALAAATRACWTLAPATCFTEMAELTAGAARLARQARTACIRGYAQVPREGVRSRPLRRLLAEALLDGAPAGAIAEAAGVPLAPSYLVLLCEAPRLAATAAAQAHWDRARARLGEPDGTLYAGDLGRLAVLFPAADEAAAAARAAAFTAALASWAPGPVHAARSGGAGLAGIPGAVAEAAEVLAIVKAVPDAEERPYRADEVLVELAILGRPEIRARLAALLSPLDAGTDLRRTLEVLLACNLDRERAARELWIHRRTLHYRLERIKELAGIDPSSARGIQLLRAALTSARLPASEGDARPGSGDTGAAEDAPQSPRQPSRQSPQQAPRQAPPAAPLVPKLTA